MTGAGNGFCAGMDLKAFAAGQTPWHETRGFAGIVQQPPRKPIIAAVEGFAVAGGLEVALACDLLVAARGAKLGIPEVKRSLIAAGGALRRLPRRVPPGSPRSWRSRATRSAPSAATTSASSTGSTEPGEALSGALALAGEIAGNGPLALAGTKQILDAQWDWSEDEFWVRQGEISGPVFVSEDAREGAVAFSEKREPVWQGR